MKYTSIFPFLRWFPLQKEKIKADLIAGMTVGFLLIPQSMAIILVANGINTLDATGEETLRNLVKELRKNGIDVVFDEVTDSVMDVMKRTDLYKIIGEENFSSSADKTYDELCRKHV